MIPVVTAMTFGQLGLLAVCCKGDGELEALPCIINVMPYGMHPSHTHTVESRKFVNPIKKNALPFMRQQRTLCGRPHKHIHVSRMSFGGKAAQNEGGGLRGT